MKKSSYVVGFRGGLARLMLRLRGFSHFLTFDAVSKKIYKEYFGPKT